MTHEEMYNLIVRDITKADILYLSDRDKEKPLGVLLTYIRDRFGIPKNEGCSIAKNVLDYFSIEN